MQTSPPRLPPGYNFLPTDEELINYYLYKKVNGGLPAEAAMLFKDYNIYGEEEPWEIFNKFEGHRLGDNGLYFFTLLSKKTVKCTKNMNRRVGAYGGTWHGDRSDEVRTSAGDVIGTKKRFRYQNKRRPDHDGWIMLQYGSECISENIVISQLKKKESKKRKSMYHSEIAEDDGIIQISPRFKKHLVINSEPTRSQAQEPQQIIHNQEMWLDAATVSKENNNSGTKPSQAHELQQITENFEMWLEAAIDSWEDDGSCATEDSFINTEPAMQVKPGQVNFTGEPTITENQETELEAGIVRVEDDVVQAAEDIFYDLTDIVNIELPFQVEPDQQLDLIQESTIISDKDDIELVDELEAAFNGYDISQIIQNFDQILQTLDDNPTEESGDRA